MHLGIQLIAPDGYFSLRKTIRYHFLSNQASHKRALLVYFTTDPPAAHIATLNRDIFEDGLTKELLVIAPDQIALPPWCGTNRPLPSEWAASTAKRRHSVLLPHLRDLQVILQAPELERELNRRARASKPTQNETRFRLWFFSILLFDNQLLALYPPTAKMGKWDRSNPAYERKPGRPSKYAGSHAGYRADTGMRENILKGYHSYKGLGVPMRKIYHKSLDKIFRCRTRTENRRTYTYHPDGDPFPTYGQFRYHVLKSVDKDQAARTKYGDVRHRRTDPVSKGQFSAAVANLMERIEADGYYTQDRPIGIGDDTTRDPLAVVCATDYASALITGIGGSLGKENALAYKAMFFCMAIDKVRFCRLFGIEIQPEDWPSIGLPPNFMVDRGPGASQRVIAEFEARFPIRGVAPAYQPQSKATVESSHPRSTRLEGSPSYVQSGLNIIEMMCREIERVLEHNKSSCAQRHVPLDWWADKRMPCPNEIWEQLNARARNDAQPISFEDAVRAFLEPVEFKVKADGLYLKHLRYDSPALRDADLLHAVARTQTTRIPGYVYPLAVRSTWVEFQGQIIEVDAQLPLRLDDAVLYLSLEDLQDYDRLRLETLNNFRDHQHAAALEARQRVRTRLGKDGDVGSRKGGQPKTDTQMGRKEADIMRRTKSGS